LLPGDRRAGEPKDVRLAPDQPTLGDPTRDLSVGEPTLSSLLPGDQTVLQEGEGAESSIRIVMFHVFLCLSDTGRLVLLVVLHRRE
jgi:hypothetical protein